MKPGKIILFCIYLVWFVNPGFAQTSKPVPPIHYFYNSGWLVETSNHAIIFDFITDTASGITLQTLEEKLAPALKKKKKILVFISHDHQDHFDSTIFSLSKKIPGIQYLLGWDYKKETPAVSLSILKPGDSLVTSDYTIYTHAATDEGSAFLLHIDDYTIYHGGDHALWAGELLPAFAEELNYIRKKASNIDLAFLPAAKGMFTQCAYDSIIEKGLRISAEILSPGYIALQHIGCADKLWQYELAHKNLAAISTKWIVPVKYNQDFGGKSK